MQPKKHLIIFSAILFIAIAFAFTRADDDPITKIVAQLTKWAELNRREKVYLHLDKPYYAAGENIWLKGYVVVGDHHQLSLLSSVLNIELINSRDSVQKSVKLLVTNGVTWGNIELPDTLKAGTYRIRAYTNYMRNAGSDYLFEKTLTIGNSVGNNVFTKVAYKANAQTINAVITYTDLNGQSYAHKEVNYSVIAGAKTIAKGKGITDGDGVLNINFTNTGAINAGRINTDIKYADKMLATKTFPIQLTANKVDVQLFPEGGYMVAGLRSKVAFKATGADGFGVDIKGVIKDNQDNEVAKVGTAHFGMGVVIFTPELGKTYQVVYTLPDGTPGKADLPAAITDKGITMGVFNNDTATLFVKIYASQSMINQDVNVVAQQNGKVYYAAKTKLTNISTTASIPKDRFPTGIVQFTLFSATGEPMSERIIFIQNPDKLKLTLSTEQKSYAPRQKVKINLDASALGKPVMGSFSAAVIDESKVPADENDEVTILNSLLLTSDLKGYVEKPNYYFNNPNEQTQADLDALMLTQGYRRFVWKQVLNNGFQPQIFQPEKALSISGQVTTLANKPIAKGKVTLFSLNDGLFMDTVTNDQGAFKFDGLLFTDSARVTVQARNKNNGNNIRLVLDSLVPPFIGHQTNPNSFELSHDNTIMAYLQNKKKQFEDFVKYGLVSKSTLLKEVVIKEKKINRERETDTFHGAFQADQLVTAEELNKSACVILWQCLEGRLFGVSFRGSSGIPYSNRTFPPSPMRIVVDGIPKEPDFSLADINVSDVATVEVLKSMAKASIYGSIGGAGLIVITTKRGPTEHKDQHNAPDVITYSPKGYAKTREFYAPRYDDPKVNTKVADLRTTVFWAPNLVTVEDGKTAFEFFNADTKGTYKVVVEGLDNDGNLARQVFRYKVE